MVTTLQRKVAEIIIIFWRIHQRFNLKWNNCYSAPKPVTRNLVSYEKEPEQHVIISEVEDIKWCFENVKEIFVKNSLDMPDRYLEMFTYING